MIGSAFNIIYLNTGCIFLMDNCYVIEMFSIFSVSAAPPPVPGTGCVAAIFSISGYAFFFFNFSFSSLLSFQSWWKKHHSLMNSCVLILLLFPCLFFLIKFFNRIQDNE